MPRHAKTRGSKTRRGEGASSAGLAQSRTKEKAPEGSDEAVSGLSRKTENRRGDEAPAKRAKSAPPKKDKNDTFKKTLPMQHWAGADGLDLGKKRGDDGPGDDGPDTQTDGSPGSGTHNGAATDTGAPPKGGAKRRNAALKGTMLGLPGPELAAAAEAAKEAVKGATTAKKKAGGAKASGHQAGGSKAASRRRQGEDPGESERPERRTDPGPAAGAGGRPAAGAGAHDVSAAPVQGVGPNMRLTSSERADHRMTSPEPYSVPDMAQAADGTDAPAATDAMDGEEDNVYLEPEQARAVLRDDPRYASFDRRPFRAVPRDRMAQTVLNPTQGGGLARPGLVKDVGLVAAGVAAIGAALWFGGVWPASDAEAPPSVQTMAAGPAAGAAVMAENATELVTIPPGAEVVREGAVVASTPSPFTRPKFPTDFLIRKAGYTSQLVRLSATSPARIVIELKPLAVGPAAGNPPAPGGAAPQAPSAP